MKQLIMKVLAVLALLAALGACSMGGAGGDSPPPAQPVPTLDDVTGILPADDTATNDASITLSWNAVSDATGYEVQLAQTEAGVPTAPVQSVATTSFDPRNSSAHFWYWRVRAVDGDEFGPWSALSSFAVRWTSATIPNATVSVNATTNVTDDTTPTFQWDPVPGAVRYELSVTSVSPPISVSEPTHTLTRALRNDIVYTWNVRAVGTVDGAESFTAATPDATFTVAWRSNGPADGFRFEEELQDLREAVNGQFGDFAGGNYRLGGDITVLGIWTPIGTEIAPFGGTFDGAGYTITGLTTIGQSFDLRGFFGVVNRGHITNLTLRDVNIRGRGFIGGLVGSLNRGTVSRSSVTGAVTGSNTSLGASVGGLVGSLNLGSMVFDSYADVVVTGGSDVGGLVGSVNQDSTVSRSYAIGSVSSQNTERGGLVGSVEGSNNTVSDSFYDLTTTGQSDDTGKGDPKTTADMQNQATFTNWDFATIWAIDPNINNGYPYLRAIPSQ